MNEVITAIGKGWLMWWVARNTPFSQLLHYAGYVFVIASLPILWWWYLLYQEDIAAAKQYQLHTTVEQGVLVQKTATENFLDPNEQDLSFIIDLNNKEIEVGYHIRPSIYTSYKKGDTVNIIVPAKEILDHYLIQVADNDTLWIKIIDNDYEKYAEEKLSIIEEYTKKMSTGQQEFSMDQYGSYQLEDTVKAQLSMWNLKALWYWSLFCLVLFLSGIFCIKRAKIVEKKHWLKTAVEIRESKEDETLWGR
jgi:hypothetical protein